MVNSAAMNEFFQKEIASGHMHRRRYKTVINLQINKKLI